jgi:hypothetical protein
MESIGRGVLGPPPSRGTTIENGGAVVPFLNYASFFNARSSKSSRSWPQKISPEGST